MPVLVPADTSHPTKKHITKETGILFEPSPEGLARAIEDVVTNLDKYHPRDYVEKTTSEA